MLFAFLQEFICKILEEVQKSCMDDKMLSLLEKGYSRNMFDNLPHSVSPAIDDITLNETEDQRFREIISDTEVFMFFEIILIIFA